MSEPWADWDHVLKLDPDKDLHDGDTFADVAACGTDALEIGGTLGMTEEKMVSYIENAAEYDIPIYQEPSNPSVVVESDALDGYLVPTVFNAGDIFWVTGAHKEWVRIEGGLDWDRTTTEAYIVLNPEASVAEYTEADCDLSTDDVAAYAEIAEKMFGQEIVYIEYSGMLGDPAVVQAAADALAAIDADAAPESVVAAVCEAEFDELLEHFLFGDTVATGQHLDSPGLVVVTHDREPGCHTIPVYCCQHKHPSDSRRTASRCLLSPVSAVETVAVTMVVVATTATVSSFCNLHTAYP